MTLIGAIDGDVKFDVTVGTSMQVPTALRANLVGNFSLPQLLNVQIEKGQIECVKQCQTEAASLMSAFHMTPFYPFSLRQKRTDRPAIT